MDWFLDLKRGLQKAFRDIPAAVYETPEELFKTLNDRDALDTLPPEMTKKLMTHI